MIRNWIYLSSIIEIMDEFNAEIKAYFKCFS